MYTAVLVEPRCHPALRWVLRNFLDNLSAEWKILVFHGTANREVLHGILESLPRDRFLEPIELEVENLTPQAYNALLMSPDFYRVIPTELHLIFQVDSLLFAEHRHFLSLFLSYDYVGAPWKNGWVGNGGLSLRRTAKMIEVCERVTPADTLQDIFAQSLEGRIAPPLPPHEWAQLQQGCMENLEEISSEMNEDMYFCYQRTLPLKKPPASTAQYFSVESVFCETSWGTHAPWKNLLASELCQMRARYPELEEYMQCFIDEWI